MTIFFANLQSFQRRLFCTLRCSGRYKFRRNFSWRKENATDKQGKKMLHIKEKKQYDKYELTILIHFERMSGPDKSYLSKFLCNFLFHSKSPGLHATYMHGGASESSLLSKIQFSGSPTVFNPLNQDSAIS